jgi:hypothetical protein
MASVHFKNEDSSRRLLTKHSKNAFTRQFTNTNTNEIYPSHKTTEKYHLARDLCVHLRLGVGKLTGVLRYSSSNLTHAQSVTQQYKNCLFTDKLGYFLSTMIHRR